MTSLQHGLKTDGEEKSSTTLFSLCHFVKQTTSRHTEDACLKTDNEPSYLGVTFDKQLTWKPHILKAEVVRKRKLAILGKLAGITWGANERIMKTVYERAVRPHQK